MLVLVSRVCRNGKTKKRLVCKSRLHVDETSTCKSTVQLENTTALFMLKLALHLFHFCRKLCSFIESNRSYAKVSRTLVQRITIMVN
jgi:hypothetical protein